MLDEALGMLRVGGPTLLIVPSMAHLELSVGKLARLVEQHFGDGSFALVAVAEGVGHAHGQWSFCARSSADIGPMGM